MTNTIYFVAKNSIYIMLNKNGTQIAQKKRSFMIQTSSLLMPHRIFIYEIKKKTISLLVYGGYRVRGVFFFYINFVIYFLLLLLKNFI